MAYDQLPPHLQGLAARGRPQHYRRDVLILEETMPADGLYILLKGRVRAFSSSLSEREVTFDIDRVGDYFGEMSLDGGPRSASVIALEPTICIKVPVAEVWEEVHASREFARDLIGRLIGRARRVTARARELALYDVRERLIARIDELAVPCPPTNERQMPERMTHLQLAGLVGASREMISRCLKDLRAEGYIDIVDHCIVVRRRLPRYG